MNIQCGAIHFIDAEKSQEAYASISGENAFKINSISELDTQTRWITNLDTGLPNQPKSVNHALFFQNNYLRLKTDQILSLLHASGDEYSPQTKATFLSKIFTNVVSLGNYLLHIENLPAFEYRKGIRKNLMDMDQKQPDNILTMIRDSTQYYTFSMEKTDPEKRVSFLTPKFSHAKKILQTPLPTGEWRQIKSLPEQSENIREWLQSRKNPFFAKVILSDFDEELYSLLNFGSAVPEGSNREWVTNIELEMLIGIADIQIIETWESSDVAEPSEVITKMIKIGDTGDTGTSLGILAENIWTGLSLSMSPPSIRRNKKIAQKYANTAAPFLIAMDRSLCFEKAKALRQKGFSVASYGYGKITVDSSFQEEKTIIESALELGLIPPYCPGLQIELSSSDNYLDYLQAFHATGDTQKLMMAVAPKNWTIW